MTDIINTISSAISMASKLKEISQNIKNAEFKNILADLSLELAEAKLKLASIITENTQLKERIHTLENIDGDPCPKCHKRGWNIVDSKPDKEFGELGAIRRSYKCSFCNFSEEILISPK